MNTVLVLALVCSAAATPTHDVSTHSLIQQEEAQSVSLSNEALVAANIEGALTMENLKSFIDKRAVSDIGLMEDLITRAACIIRLETDTGVPLSTTSLKDFLTSRELSTAGNKDELLDRACDYQSAELEALQVIQKSLISITKEELKASLANLGYVSTSGTKPELVYRLGKAHRDLSTIRKLLNDQNFEAAHVKEYLTARSLDTSGTIDKLLSRLADYLVHSSENTVMPGISSHCDMVLEGPICIHGGAKVISADAKPLGLVGKWTFDDEHMLDHSGHAHHAVEAGQFGPGLNGFGQSAKFDGSNFVELPHSDDMLSPNFCVTYWMYLLSDSDGEWRTVMHKGSRDNERTFTFFMEPQTRGIELFVSTTDDSQPSGERVWSNTFIPLRRWTHVAGCLEGQNMRIFINGILDAENTTVGTPILNHGPIYVGQDPWRGGPGIIGYVDEIRFYARMLSVDEIQAEAGFALGLVEPAFVELGCMGCSLDNCPKTCRKGYRMCTERDLFAGGYFVARAMGWAATDTRVWKAEDGKAAVDTYSTAGLCVCCKIGEES